MLFYGYIFLLASQQLQAASCCVGGLFDTHGSRGRCWLVNAQHRFRRQHHFECGTIDCDPLSSCQSLRTSPHRDVVLHYGRNTAAERAGQRAAGGSSRANLPTCGEDRSGVPGRSRPLQKRGYPAEKASGTAVRFER